MPACEPRATQSANRFGMWASMIENRGRVQQQYLSTNLSLTKRRRSHTDVFLLRHRAYWVFEHFYLRGQASHENQAGFFPDPSRFTAKANGPLVARLVTA